MVSYVTIPVMMSTFYQHKKLADTLHVIDKVNPSLVNSNNPEFGSDKIDIYLDSMSAKSG